MVIRNAERPDGKAAGVMPDGNPDLRSLTVRGWQRAGALVRLFNVPNPHLARPSYIYAAVDRPPGKSLRALQTVMPLAEELGLTINMNFMIGEEAALVTAAMMHDDAALIAWQRGYIPLIAGLLMYPNRAALPDWPRHRFDLVWVFNRSAQGTWDLTEVAQKLLAGDALEPGSGGGT